MVDHVIYLHIADGIQVNCLTGVERATLPILLQNDGSVNWSSNGDLRFANGTVNNDGTWTASPNSNGLRAYDTATGQDRKSVVQGTSVVLGGGSPTKEEQARTAHTTEYNKLVT